MDLRDQVGTLQPKTGISHIFVRHKFRANAISWDLHGFKFAYLSFVDVGLLYQGSLLTESPGYMQYILKWYIPVEVKKHFRDASKFAQSQVENIAKIINMDTIDLIQ